MMHVYYNLFSLPSQYQRQKMNKKYHFARSYLILAVHYYGRADIVLCNNFKETVLMLESLQKER